MPLTNEQIAEQAIGFFLKYYKIWKRDKKLTPLTLITQYIYGCIGTLVMGKNAKIVG